MCTLLLSIEGYRLGVLFLLIMAAKTDKNGLVTRGMLDEAVDALLKGMDSLYEKFKSEMNSQIGYLRGEMNTRFGKVEDEIHGVKIELSHVKDEVKGLKADLSITPSRRELEILKKKVDKHIQLPH